MISFNRKHSQHLAARKRARGFTLVELGIVVAIGAAIVGVGIAVVPGILASNRVNAEVSELPAIVSNIQRAYSNQPNLTGVTLPTLIRHGVFPESRARRGVGGGTADTTATNRWGGSITVAGTSTLTGGMTLVYDQVPSAECRELVPALSSAVRIIEVGSTVVKADGGTVNMDTLGTACNAAAVTTVRYSFSK